VAVDVVEEGVDGGLADGGGLGLVEHGVQQCLGSGLGGVAAHAGLVAGPVDGDGGPAEAGVALGVGDQVDAAGDGGGGAGLDGSCRCHAISVARYTDLSSPLHKILFEVSQ
jgi:hypothetical protein